MSTILQANRATHDVAPKNQRSLAALYAEVARANQKFPAIIRESQILTHSDFWDAIQSFAINMQTYGVKEGSLIALNSADVLASMAMVFATSALGARFVVASHTLALAKVIKPTHFFRTSEVNGSPRVDFKVIDETWLPTEQTRSATLNLAIDPTPNKDWLYLHTSGTTGLSKYIALSEKLVLDRTAAVAKDFPFQRTTMASTFSPVSRPFLARGIATLMNAGALVDSGDFDYWKKVGVNLVCGSPLQVGKLLEGVSFRPRLARIEVSGAKLPDDIAENLLQNFEHVIDVYGAAETNKSFENFIEHDSDGRLVRRGMAVNSEVEIVTASGERCEVSVAGSVRVRNSYVAQGYVNSPEATAKSFRDGWFYPGDIAMWGKNGELIVIGRDDDVINIGGYKLNAGMLDMFFRSIPGISDAIAFANPKPHAVEKILVFVVLGKEVERANVISVACERANTTLGLSIGADSVRPIDAIPRTEEGKPDRRACRKMVMARAGLTWEVPP